MVIKTGPSAHVVGGMVQSPMATSAPAPEASSERIEAITSEYFQFVWRLLRRLGIPPTEVDDAAQEVFEVATRRLMTIEPGRERAFLFKTSQLIAKKTWRLAHQQRQREGADAAGLVSESDDPEMLSLRMERRRLLDVVLDAMNEELRTVFVLFELEGLRMREIAELLEIPEGTVASRLRRAREVFHAQAELLQGRRRACHE